MDISGLYFRMNTSTTPAYAIRGVMIFVDESATRYAAATRSGVISGFTWYNIGMKIGPNNIHLDVSPPIKMLIIAVIIMKPIINKIGALSNPRLTSNVAPKYVM